jgi:hypothetical protein
MLIVSKFRSIIFLDDLSTDVDAEDEDEDEFDDSIESDDRDVFMLEMLEVCKSDELDDDKYKTSLSLEF